ncbi:MAG TPA: hypothetical protein VFL04_04255 [Rectinemataceae bacterium]|nr:hypothetical protein [Rectinemataceae bacterium]
MRKLMSLNAAKALAKAKRRLADIEAFVRRAMAISLTRSRPGRANQ